MTEFFLSGAEMMARTFGVVLGAASCSDHVSNERIDAVAEKMKAVLTVTAHNNREAQAARDRFSAAVVVGRRAVREGEIQEWAAESAFRQLEHDLEGAPLTVG